MSEDIDWAKKRLNSIMKELEQGSKYVDGDSSNAAHYITRRALDILNEIKDKFPNNQLIPSILTRKELREKYQYAELYYIFTTIREIGDALGIEFSKDKEEQSGPIMAQYQNQSSTQINLQSVDNVIECINSLQIEWAKKEELVSLTKEFEEATKKKDSGKLKTILKKVAEISPKVAGFLLEHASELGLLALLL